jgi:hypothetical protein
MGFRPPVVKALRKMDVRQIFMSAVKGSRMATDNIKKFARFTVDDVLLDESTCHTIIVVRV